MPKRRVENKGMSAHDLMKAQMDELMGKNRGVAGGHNAMDVEPDFSDPHIDRYFLCGCSPYELLKGTKSEQLPQLDREGFVKERSEGLRLRWEALSQRDKDRYGFERDLYELLTSLVAEHDRRISRLRERYDRENREVPEVNTELKKEFEGLKDQAAELQVQSELLGEEGDVEGALAAFQQAAAVLTKAQEVERRAMPRDQKRQYVDDVSGLVYSSTDSEARIADLQAGKQYKGWRAIRDKLVELEERASPNTVGEAARHATGIVSASASASALMTSIEEASMDMRGAMTIHGAATIIEVEDRRRVAILTIFTLEDRLIGGCIDVSHYLVFRSY